MRRMEIAYSVWSYIVALAAVINGLGIVRLLSGFASYLRKRDSLSIKPYWVMNVLITFQLFMHILLWWSLLSVREAGSINFLTYIYLITGPTLLFLGSNFLELDVDSDEIDMRAEYYRLRKPYFSLAATFWLWIIFLWPVFVGKFAPTLAITVPMLLIAATLRITDNPKVHAVGVVGFWALYLIFVGLYGMQLGGVGRTMTQS
jgi:hypothetical protein